MALLEVSNLGIAFGGLQAVSQLDLSIEKGHLYGLIGPNGAGKTTVFNMLTGVYRPTEGNIVLDGKDITGQNPELISRAGVARTFQNIRLFNDMTVLDLSLIHISGTYGAVPVRIKSGWRQREGCPVQQRLQRKRTARTATPQSRPAAQSKAA